MSYNRLRYDQCAYKKELDQSVGPLAYMLYPGRYENCSKCRHEFGLLGGTAVSHIKGNLVDLENDLRGQTRAATKCPAKKFKPNNSNTIEIVGNHCNEPRTVDLTPVHLPSCQMIRYPSTPLPPAQDYGQCPAPCVESQKPCQNPKDYSCGASNPGEIN